MKHILTPDMIDFSRTCVLCWLATADQEGQPNVSPKEIFTLTNDGHILIANIASPKSAQNICFNSKVCVSFIHIFLQKGFKVYGSASILQPTAAQFEIDSQAFYQLIGKRFTIHSIFRIKAHCVQPILAPSYQFYPNETTEASQTQASLQNYKVRSL